MMIADIVEVDSKYSFYVLLVPLYFHVLQNFPCLRILIPKISFVFLQKLHIWFFLTILCELYVLTEINKTLTGTLRLNIQFLQCLMHVIYHMTHVGADMILNHLLDEKTRPNFYSSEIIFELSPENFIQTLQEVWR